MALPTCHPCAFYQEPSLLKIPLPKSSKLEIPNNGWPLSKLEIPNHGWPLSKLLLGEGEPWKYTFVLPESIPSVRISPTSLMPSDMQDASINMPFGPNVVEKCERNEEVIQFLMSTSTKRRDIESGFSFSDLTGFLNSGLDLPLQMKNSFGNSYVNDFSKLHPSYSQSEFDVQLNELEDNKASYQLLMSAYLNWKVLKLKSEDDIEDLLSCLSELYMPKKWIRSDRHAIIVPYFDRLRLMPKRSQVFASSVDFQGVFAVESTRKLKITSAPSKKQGRNAANKRSLVEKNYFYACECLMSLLLNPYRNDTLAILSIKTSSKLPNLLDKFATGIAGTGLAVIFYVICKVAGGMVPFCAIRLVHAGLGLGLIWLSWSVNGLRNIITEIIYNPSKTGYGESEMMKRINRSVNEILFRSLALMAVSVLTSA